MVVLVGAREVRAEKGVVFCEGFLHQDRSLGICAGGVKVWSGVAGPPGRARRRRLAGAGGANAAGSVRGPPIRGHATAASARIQRVRRRTRHRGRVELRWLYGRSRVLAKSGVLVRSER